MSEPWVYSVDEIKQKWEKNYWDDRHLTCHRAIATLFIHIEQAERALAVARTELVSLAELADEARSHADREREETARQVGDVIRSIAQRAEDTGVNELIRFAQLLRGEGP